MIPLAIATGGLLPLSPLGMATEGWLGATPPPASRPGRPGDGHAWQPRRRRTTDDDEVALLLVAAALETVCRP